MNYAIILAGGTGTRFWPLSRQLQPKQFLNICSEKSMIEETVNRISPLIKKENVYIAANKIHNRKMRECIKTFDIPFKNFLLEPEVKNTLSPIAVLSKIIYNQDKDAIIAVLPSDHFVKDNKKFIKLLAKGFQIARKGYIVTLGALPTSPETGYGYIKVKGKRKKEKVYYKVDRFVEKPNLLKAKGFLKEGIYYWNCGIFIFRLDTMLEEIKNFTPKVYGIIMKMKNRRDCVNLWGKLPSISIDYAIMEKTDKGVVLPANCGWTDLGSWQAITELLKKNKDSNIFKGRCIDIGSKNSFIWSDSRLVATLGLKDTIVVNTKDAVLVCAKGNVQDVKKIVGLLKQNNLKKYL